MNCDRNRTNFLGILAQNYNPSGQVAKARIVPSLRPFGLHSKLWASPSFKNQNQGWAVVEHTSIQEAEIGRSL